MSRLASGISESGSPDVWNDWYLAGRREASAIEGCRAGDVPARELFTLSIRVAAPDPEDGGWHAKSEINCVTAYCSSGRVPSV